MSPIFPLHFHSTKRKINCAKLSLSMGSIKMNVSGLMISVGNQPKRWRYRREFKCAGIKFVLGSMLIPKLGPSRTIKASNLEKKFGGFFQNHGKKILVGLQSTNFFLCQFFLSP